MYFPEVLSRITLYGEKYFSCSTFDGILSRSGTPNSFLTVARWRWSLMEAEYRPFLRSLWAVDQSSGAEVFRAPDPHRFEIPC